MRVDAPDAPAAAPGPRGRGPAGTVRGVRGPNRGEEVAGRAGAEPGGATGGHGPTAARGAERRGALRMTSSPCVASSKNATIGRAQTQLYM